MKKEPITIDFKPDAVIIGNGDFPSHPCPLSILESSRFTVCCDGAANEYIQSGRLPDCIVGDGDSLCEKYKQEYAHILHLSPDQETNDQTKAIKYLASIGKQSVAIIAATGKREDHTIGNISLLMEYLRMGMDVRIYTDYGIFIPAIDDNCFIHTPGSQVSIFGFGTSGMMSEGLVYPLRDFTSWWQGTLNEVAISPFSIHCKGDYIVFLNYPNIAF